MQHQIKYKCYCCQQQKGFTDIKIGLLKLYACKACGFIGSRARAFLLSAFIYLGIPIAVFVTIHLFRLKRLGVLTQKKENNNV